MSAKIRSSRVAGLLAVFFVVVAGTLGIAIWVAWAPASNVGAEALTLTLAPWRRFAIVLLLLAGFGALGMAAACIMLIGSLKRRERDLEETRMLNSRAAAANRAESAFLAMMSHEIRTPLTAIIGCAELMTRPQATGADRDTGAVILRNGQHLLHLINDLLDLSKIEAGRLDLERRAFSPLELLDGVQAMMGAQAASKGIGFDVVLEHPFPDRVMGDPTRWKQIVVNLCSNAIKFTDLGNVRLTLWYDSGRAKLVCNVVDTGIGIPAHQHALLFQPFSQADSTVARKYGGTGLGLHLVRQLAGKMGGNVVVASEFGLGSVFEIEIDAALADGSGWLDQAARPTAPARQADPFGMRLHGRVLLAEDRADNRRLIIAFLDAIGLDVEVAEDGAQAVALALAGGFGVILMDMQMPVMDGVQATIVLRAAGCGAPIVALSANVMPEDVQRYLRAGCTGCIGKPIDFGELGGLLAQLLGQAGMPSAAPARIEQMVGYAALRADFSAALTTRLAQLAAHIGAQAWSEAAALAHQLKGSAGSFGYPGVTHGAGDIEMAAVRADGPLARAAFARLLALDELMPLKLAASAMLPVPQRSHRLHHRRVPGMARHTDDIVKKTESGVPS